MCPEAHDGLSDNDFDIVEHFSDDENDNTDKIPSTKTNAVFNPKESFPKALHRSKMEHGLGREEYKKPHTEANGIVHTDKSLIKQEGDIGLNNSSIASDMMDGVTESLDISQMTEAEILEHQQFLYDKLGKEMCEFLIQRKLKKLIGEDSNNVTKRDDTPNGPKEDVSGHIPSAVCDEALKQITFKMDVNELRKIEWTNPVESVEETENGELRLHQLRFDFDGQLLKESGTDVPHRHEGALYNHGAEPNKAGYTIPELMELMKSSFKPHVQIATRTMCNIVHMAYAGPQRYFGYTCQRWHGYLLRDVDLVGKIGYIAVENVNTLQILIDSLRCMSIMLFGDLIPSKNRGKLPMEDEVSCCFGGILLPLQEVIFDLCPQEAGLNCYSWNPLAMDCVSFIDNVPEKKDRSHRKRSKGEHEEENAEANEIAEKARVSSLDTRCDEIAAFYRKAVEGKLLDEEIDTIKQQLADAFGLKVTDYYTGQNMDSTIRLLTQFAFLNRLFHVMKQNKTNVVLQAYSLTVICGLLMRLGRPLAKALLETSQFNHILEELTSSLIVGTEDYIKLSDGLLTYALPEDVEPMKGYLSAAVMCCMRIISVFNKEALTSHLDRMGAIALVKQTISQAYICGTSPLLGASDDRSCTLYTMNPHVVLPCTMAIRCLTVWAMQNTYVDTLDEIMPAMDLEMFTLCDHAKSDGDSFNSFIGNNGIPMSQILTYMANILESSDLSMHVRFNWPRSRFYDLVVELCKHDHRHSDHKLMRLILSTFYFEKAYVEFETRICVADKRTKLAEEQRSALLAMTNYVVSTCIQFCKNADNFDSQLLDFQWWNWETLVGNVQPLASSCYEANETCKTLFPVILSLWMLEIVDSIGNIDEEFQMTLKNMVSHPFALLHNKLVLMLETLYKRRLHSVVGSGFDKGATSYKPFMMLEPWAKFILLYGISQGVDVGIDRRNLEARATLAALTVSPRYSTIQGLIQRLCLIYGDGNTLPVSNITDDFKEFNRNIAECFTLGTADMAIISFIAFIPAFVIRGLASNEEYTPSNAIKGLLELIFKNKLFTDEFLEWVPELDTANTLIQSVISFNDEINWNPNAIFVEALEALVFRRLSCMLNKAMAVPRITNLDAVVTATWDELIDHMAEVNVSVGDDYILMFAAPVSIATKDAEHDALTKATMGVISKFNSGLGDSPYVMAALMLMISTFSRVDCAMKVWADTNLMVLLGRNLFIDLVTREVICTTPSGKISLGSVYLYLPTYNSEAEIIVKQQKLLQEFNEEDIVNRNAIMAIVTASIRRINKR